MDWTKLLTLLAVLTQIEFTGACQCYDNEALERGTEHLKTVAKIKAMTLLPPIRTIIMQNQVEKVYLLDKAKHKILNDLHLNYGKLLTHTDFVRHFDSFIDDVRELLTSDEKPSEQTIHSEISRSFRHFMTRQLPSSFLCLAMGECRAATVRYRECMDENANELVKVMDAEIEKTVKNLAESLHVYRSADAFLDETQKDLLKITDKIPKDCYRRYMTLTNCSRCAGDVGYCHASCYTVAHECFQVISVHWDNHLSNLQRTTKHYEEGFVGLDRGVRRLIREMVEIHAPRLAQIIVSKCGSISKDVLATALTSYRNPTPEYVQTKTEVLVVALRRRYNGYWEGMRSNLCTSSSTSTHCWNGTNIVLNAVQQRHHFDESDAVIAKLDVRPKPKESKNDNWLEASGYPSWEDDEDLGGEVSGSGKEPSDDAAVEFVQEFTTTPKPIGITPATTRTTPHPKFAKGEAAAKPNFEVVEKVPEEPEEKKTVPDSTGCLSLWIVAVLSGAHLLRWW